jgi:ATP-dependent exoDNAse (exonuclease V) alpha subunit
MGLLSRTAAGRADDTTYRVGDRVTFTRNDRHLGLLNGDFGTITAARFGVLLKPQLTIRLDDPGAKTWLGTSRPRFVTVTLSDGLAMRLGYAVTTHKAQGTTVDRCFVFGSGAMMDRELAYVQMSRAREATKLYASRDTATEEVLDLATSMARSRRKDLALDQTR